ncbi:MAG TPA: E2/UBC family protein [Actinomycetota bacterium]|nr:E2/UBC family protein [Actinomycetota bacterium]
MSLPEYDLQYLTERTIPHELVTDAGMVCVVLPDWKLPAGLSVTDTTVLLRLPGGYPDVAPDMWWCWPAVKRADGGVIRGTELTETHLGRSWQRWSRHFAAGQWKSGIDGLESYLALMTAEFVLAAQGHAA